VTGIGVEHFNPLLTIMKGMVRAYRWGISPFLVPSCRFAPTCSEYALDALNRFGALRGTYLTTRRVLRCHPWGGSGFDPVPDRTSPGPSPISKQQ
jgi:putative membrane protein insertion efficiency factor